MSTHSMIGRENPDGTVDAIYCHFDGYPRHHVPLLAKYWSGASKVAALLNMGDLEKLGPVCQRMDDIDAEEMRRYENREEFLQKGFAKEAAHFLYLWSGTGWLACKKGGSTFHIVDPTPYMATMEAGQAMSDKPCPNCVFNFNCPTCNQATAEVDRLRAELSASKLAFVELGRKLDAMTDLLCEVMAAPCDTSGGEYAPDTVREGMKSADDYWNGVERVEPNADLLARVAAVTKEG